MTRRVRDAEDPIVRSLDLFGRKFLDQGRERSAALLRDRLRPPAAVADVLVYLDDLALSVTRRRAGQQPVGAPKHLRIWGHCPAPLALDDG
jgi:hypothetical protein